MKNLNWQIDVDLEGTQVCMLWFEVKPKIGGDMDQNGKTWLRTFDLVSW